METETIQKKENKAVPNGVFYYKENKKILPDEIKRAKLNPKAGEIIISRMNTPQLVGESGFIEQNFPQLFIPDRLWQTKIDKENFNSRWLSYFLITEKTRRNLKNIATGTSDTMKNISKPNFLALTAGCPPLPEQQKISSFLSSVDKKIQQLTHKKEWLETYKMGVMQKLFSQELKFKIKGSGGEPIVPPEWAVKKLGDMLSQIVDNRGKTPPLSEIGIPLIEINALNGRNIDYNKVSKFVKQETYMSWFRKYLEDGDVLFSTVGQTAICSIYSSRKLAAIAQNIVGLRFKKGELKEFMFYLLSEPHNNHQFKKIEMGAVQPSVKVSQMIHISFKVPCLEEQQKIAEFLSAIDRKIETVQQQITKTQSFKKGLLQQMFV